MNEKEKWTPPEKQGYRNPNIHVYPDLEGYTGEVRTANGQIIGNSGTIQPDSHWIQQDSHWIHPGSRPIHMDSQADYGDYFSDATDIVNRRNVIKSIFSKRRNAHAARNSEKKHPYRYSLRRTGEVAAVLSLLIACGSTLKGFDVYSQIGFYLIPVLFAFMTDAYKFTGRMFSMQSRVLISIMIGMSIVSTYIYNPNYYKVVVIVSIIFSFMIWKLNKFWKDEENWNLSDAVQQVLVNTPGTEVIKVWENNGKEKARTLCYELGLEIDELVLDGFCRPLVCLGIAMVYKQVCELKSKESNSTRRAEAYKSKYEDAIRRLDEKEKEALSEDEEIREYIINANREASDAKKKIEMLEKENADLKQRIIDLSPKEVANYNEYKSLTEPEKEKRDSEAVESMKNGSTAMQARDIAGVPYKRCLKLRKENNIE